MDEKYVKKSVEELKENLTEVQYKVTTRKCYRSTI